MKNKILSIIMILVILISCKENNIILQEKPIVLYPNMELIKNQYYKYSLLDPFNPHDTLYTSIEPNFINPKKAKTLIKGIDPFNLQYFTKYILDKKMENTMIIFFLKI